MCSISPHPCHQGVHAVERHREDIVGDYREVVGEQYLFGQTDDQEPEPDGKILTVDPAVVDFMRYVMIFYDRPRHQLREKRHIQRQVQQISLRFVLLAVGVDQVRDDLKRVKGDAKRQSAPGYVYGPVNPVIKKKKHRYRVLERDKYRQIQHDAQCKRCAAYLVAKFEAQTIICQQPVA